MPLKSNVVDVHAKARDIIRALQQVHSVCVDMSTNIPLNRYDAVVIFPSASYVLSSQIVQLANEGYTFTDLAPYVADIFHYPTIAAAEADYNTLKIAVPDLASAIIGAQLEFKHSFAPNGSRVYDQPVSEAVKSDIITKVTAILALFE